MRAIQEPREDERPIVVSIHARRRDIVDVIVAKLGIATEAGKDRESGATSHGTAHATEDMRRR